MDMDLLEMFAYTEYFHLMYACVDQVYETIPMWESILIWLEFFISSGHLDDKATVYFEWIHF